MISKKKRACRNSRPTIQTRFKEPKLNPLTFRALGLLALRRPYYEGEVDRAAESLARDYAQSMESAGLTPKAALTDVGVISSESEATWDEVRALTKTQALRLHHAFDLYTAGGC